MLQIPGIMKCECCGGCPEDCSDCPTSVLASVSGLQIKVNSSGITYTFNCSDIAVPQQGDTCVWQDTVNPFATLCAASPTGMKIYNIAITCSEVAGDPGNFVWEVVLAINGGGLTTSIFVTYTIAATGGCVNAGTYTFLDFTNPLGQATLIAAGSASVS